MDINNNIEKLLIERIEMQDKLINRQIDIIESHTKSLQKINDSKDVVIRFVILVSSISLVLILSVFIISYFVSPSGWDNTLKVENKTTTTNENINKNITKGDE